MAARALAPAVSRAMGLVDTAFAGAMRQPTITPAQIGALLSLGHEIFEASPKGLKVLEVGTGSGYLTACLGVMLSERPQGGSLVAIDTSASALEAAQSNAAKAITSEAVKMLSYEVADALALPPSHAEYDLILGGLATPVVPKQLYERLAPGGVLVLALGPAAPRGSAGQSLSTIAKNAAGLPVINHRRFAGVFPPLESPEPIVQLEGLKGIWF